MKTMTEQRRQELIERLKKIAAWDENYGPDHNVMLPASEAKAMAEAYISSLMAESVYQERRFISKRNSTVEYWAEVDKSTFGYIHESQRRVVYTAPPVPVIKLPDAFDDYGPKFDEFRRGYNECIAEFNRLNGLGE